MIKKYFIYQVIGWPTDGIMLLAPRVCGMGHAYYVNPVSGYDSIEEAEEHLAIQQEAEKLEGEFVILPVYLLKEKRN